MLFRRGDLLQFDPTLRLGEDVGVVLDHDDGVALVDQRVEQLGNTRVLPEEMGATAARLRPIFERLLQARTPA